MTQASIMRDVRNPLGLHFNRKYLKSGQKWPIYGQFTNGRLRDSSEYHMQCKGSIRASLNQKYLKSGQKWPSYGQFTNGRLRDSIKFHVECIGPIRASLEPKRSKIGQEMAELWPIYQREVA